MIEVVAPQRELANLARQLDHEADGRQMRTDLATNLYEAIEPIVPVVKGALMGMATGGLDRGGEPLRTAVARQVEPHIRLSGKAPGAFIRVKKQGMPRGFHNAPKRLNARKGWRHRVFGHDVWVHQLGEPGWFDDNVRRGALRYRVAVERAMQDSADRVARSA